MGAARLEYKIIGKYTSGREITAYHVKCSNGKSNRVSKEQLYYLVGRGQVVNAKGQIYEDKVVLSGVGESLDSIPSKKDPLIDKNQAVNTTQQTNARQPRVQETVANTPTTPIVSNNTQDKMYKSKTASRNQMKKLESVEPVMPVAFIRFCLNKEINIVEIPCMVKPENQSGENVKHQMNGELEVVKRDGTKIPFRVVLKKIQDDSKSRDLGGTNSRYTCEILFKDGRQQALQVRTIGTTVTVGGSMFGFGNQKVSYKKEVDSEATALEISNRFVDFLKTL